MFQSRGRELLLEMPDKTQHEVKQSVQGERRLVRGVVEARGLRNGETFRNTQVSVVNIYLLI